MPCRPARRVDVASRRYVAHATVRAGMPSDLPRMYGRLRVWRDPPRLANWPSPREVNSGAKVGVRPGHRTQRRTPRSKSAVLGMHGDIPRPAGAVFGPTVLSTR